MCLEIVFHRVELLHPSSIRTIAVENTYPNGRAWLMGRCGSQSGSRGGIRVGRQRSNFVMERCVPDDVDRIDHTTVGCNGMSPLDVLGRVKNEHTCRHDQSCLSTVFLTIFKHNVDENT